MAQVNDYKFLEQAYSTINQPSDIGSTTVSVLDGSVFEAGLTVYMFQPLLATESRSDLFYEKGVIESVNENVITLTSGLINAKEINMRMQADVPIGFLEAIKTDITANETNITQNATDIAENVTTLGTQAQAIFSNLQSIEANKTLIQTNTADILAHTEDINNNAIDITQNQVNIQTNIQDITQNTTDIAQNTTDIATNVTNIAQNTTDIVQNTTDISTNEQAITDNTDKIQELMSEVGFSPIVIHDLPQSNDDGATVMTARRITDDLLLDERGIKVANSLPSEIYRYETAVTDNVAGAFGFNKQASPITNGSTSTDSNRITLNSTLVYDTTEEALFFDGIGFTPIISMQLPADNGETAVLSYDVKLPADNGSSELAYLLTGGVFGVFLNLTSLAINLGNSDSASFPIGEFTEYQLRDDYYKFTFSCRALANNNYSVRVIFGRPNDFRYTTYDSGDVTVSGNFINGIGVPKTNTFVKNLTAKYYDTQPSDQELLGYHSIEEFRAGANYIRQYNPENILNPYNKDTALLVDRFLVTTQEKEKVSTLRGLSARDSISNEAEIDDDIIIGKHLRTNTQKDRAGLRQRLLASRIIPRATEITGQDIQLLANEDIFIPTSIINSPLTNNYIDTSGNTLSTLLEGQWFKYQYPTIEEDLALGVFFDNQDYPLSNVNHSFNDIKSSLITESDINLNNSVNITTEGQGVTWFDNLTEGDSMVIGCQFYIPSTDTPLSNAVISSYIDYDDDGEIKPLNVLGTIGLSTSSLTEIRTTIQDDVTSGIQNFTLPSPYTETGKVDLVMQITKTGQRNLTVDMVIKQGASAVNRSRDCVLDQLNDRLIVGFCRGNLAYNNQPLETQQGVYANCFTLKSGTKRTIPELTALDPSSFVTDDHVFKQLPISTQ